MHQRIADQNDLALVHQHRNANRAILGRGVEDMADQAQHMRRFPRGPGDQPVAMPMGQHQ